MKDELLREEVSHQDGGQYLKVRMFIKGDIFAGNANADEPIFKKGDFSYDKYELAKIISFQQLEMLVRPFKNNPYYKRYGYLGRCLKILPLIMLLVIVFLACSHYFPSIVKVEKESGLVFALIFNSFLCIVLICIFYFKKKIKKEFVRYCDELNLENEHINIIAYEAQAVFNPIKWTKLEAQYPGKYSLFASTLTYIQITSRQLLDEEKSVKIYYKGIFRTLEPLGLLNFDNFRFDKAKLQRIISLVDVDQIFRPFVQKASFKRYTFWLKAFMLAMFSYFLALVPLLIKQDEIYLQIQVFSILAIAVSFLFLSSFKMLKASKKTSSQFVQFCKEISLRERRVKIIVHMYEEGEERANQPRLYCMEVKEIHS